MGCPGFLDLVCNAVSSTVHGAETGVANSIVNFMATEAVAAERWAISNALGVFLHIGQPNLLSNGPVRLLEQDTVWFAGFAGVLGMLVAAIRLALERKASSARFAVRGMLNVAFTFTISTSVITLGEKAGFAYSKWIIQKALNSGNGQAQVKNLENLAVLVNKLGGSPSHPAQFVGGLLVPALVMILVAIFAFIGATAQIFLALTRNAMLALLAGLLPVSAGASTTETGMAWFRKHMNWTFAFLLYEPVAATIIAFACMNLMDPNGVNEVSGGILFVLSAVSLPALMRLAVPMVTQATTHGGGGGGVAAAAGTVGVAGMGIRAVSLPVGAVVTTGAAVAGRLANGARQPPGRNS